MAKEDENQLYEIMTLGGIEQKSQSFIPHSQVLESNPFSEEHDFGHHPHERRVEVHDMMDFECEIKGGIPKIFKMLSPLGAKIRFHIKKGNKEEQKFKR